MRVEWPRSLPFSYLYIAVGLFVRERTEVIILIMSYIEKLRLTVVKVNASVNK